MKKQFSSNSKAKEKKKYYNQKVIKMVKSMWSVGNIWTFQNPTPIEKQHGKLQKYKMKFDYLSNPPRFQIPKNQWMFSFN